MLVFVAVLVGSLSSPKKIGPNQIESDKIESNKKPATSRFGIFIGCLSMICIAIGIVIIKEVLVQTDVFWATLVRVVAGAISLFAILFFHPKRKTYLAELKFSKAWAYAVPASVFGNYLALLCWVGGMKYTTASRAAILNQMSTIFIFILAAIFLNERITRNRLIAITLALTGAGLTILG